MNQAGQNNSAADSAVQGYPVQQQLPQQLPVLQAPSSGSAVAPDVTSSSGQQSSSGVTSSSNSSPSKRQKSAVTNSSTLPDIRLVFYFLSFAFNTKGQLISKGIFSVFNSPQKNKLENVDFGTSLLGQKFFVPFFWRIEKTKSPPKITDP